MNIRFLKQAVGELDDAFNWYNEQLPGLGYDFLDEIDLSIRRIHAYPESSEVIEEGIRRCIINRFPYGILYGIDTDTLVIIAVAHLHRMPRYWHGRRK